VNTWLVAATVLTGAVGLCGVLCAFVDRFSALAALELAGTLTTAIMLLLSEGLKRQSFVDLGLVLAFLTVIGGLAFARAFARRI
jgi:multisubunit Na+/H+ antiporter MnhF subunit